MKVLLIFLLASIQRCRCSFWLSESVLSCWTSLRWQVSLARRYTSILYIVSLCMESNALETFLNNSVYKRILYELFRWFEKWSESGKLWIDFSKTVWTFSKTFLNSRSDTIERFIIINLSSYSSNGSVVLMIPSPPVLRKKMTKTFVYFLLVSNLRTALHNRRRM